MQHSSNFSGKYFLLNMIFFTAFYAIKWNISTLSDLFMFVLLVNVLMCNKLWLFEAGWRGKLLGVPGTSIISIEV